MQMRVPGYSLSGGQITASPRSVESVTRVGGQGIEREGNANERVCEDRGSRPVNMTSSLSSPCNDVGCKAQHEGANEGADLLGGPLPPSSLFL